MFIIWKGYGFLVPFITIAIVGVISVVFWKLFPTTLFLGPCIGSFAAAAAVWFIGNKFNSADKNRVMIDKQSGQEFLFKPDHSLFFIKMQYWAFVIAAVGAFLLLGTFIP
ncbi:hypothetical protein [Pedobacter sp. MC2016-24]|uniref:hypothetical protein n=1 Tax=Pedobacter sp. MC2016-24 TaxID=2780090 RepID=UPI0018804364|nr:hypothetical protein [Pedobacter sp. MC2016-24]MBE9599422.1 hypothetical protein [Pedobacter sp. MC2016-24]